MPRQVLVGVSLTYAAMALAAVRLLLQGANVAGVSPALIGAFYAATFGGVLFLNYMTSKARNWARFAQLLLFLGGTPEAVRVLGEALVGGHVADLLSVLVILASTAGIILVFFPNSNAWFGSRACAR